MLSSSIDGHACIINCDRLLSCGLFVMPCHGKFHCTSFNDGNPMINGKNALVTVTVDLGWWVALERNERTRTRTETQRGEVEQPHTQSFGHKSRANFKFGRLHKLRVWTVTPGNTRNAGAREGSRGS